MAFSTSSSVIGAVVSGFMLMVRIVPSLLTSHGCPPVSSKTFSMAPSVNDWFVSSVNWP